MTASEPTIVASSIGFRSRGTGDTWDWDIDPDPPLCGCSLPTPGRIPEVAASSTTATGDHPQVISSMYGAFGPTEFRVSHLSLFMMPSVRDIREHLLAQDVIWVMGGSVVNLLAVWRAHGLDAILHEAWQAGVVIGGVSAGSICWHLGGTTDSFGLDLAARHERPRLAAIQQWRSLRLRSRSGDRCSTGLSATARCLTAMPLTTARLSSIAARSWLRWWPRAGRRCVESRRRRGDRSLPCRSLATLGAGTKPRRTATRAGSRRCRVRRRDDKLAVRDEPQSVLAPARCPRRLDAQGRARS